MALYFGETEITNIDNLVPQYGLDITDIWFGSTNVYTIWQTYEGTLPATFNANGDDMRQYQIYGNVGGVGDKTENLFNGYFEQGTTAGGIPIESNNRVRSNIITAVVGAFSVDFKNEENFDVAFDFWRDSLLVEATSWLNLKNYITPDNATSVRIKIRKNNDAPVTPAEVIDFGMYSGTTPPETFVPFGYEVDMSVSDGTNNTTTPIYIGGEPLWKVGDYADIVDYKQQKIVRAINKTVLTGSETYPLLKNLPSSTSNYLYYARRPDILPGGENAEVFCSHLPYRSGAPQNTVGINSKNDYNVVYLNFGSEIMNAQPSGNTINGLKEYLRSQYAAGTPVTIWYILTTPIEEDPPVALPALPTCEGTTIVDYVGQSQAVPEKVLFEYRKEGF